MMSIEFIPPEPPLGFAVVVWLHLLLLAGGLGMVIYSMVRKHTWWLIRGLVTFGFGVFLRFWLYYF